MHKHTRRLSAVWTLALLVGMTIARAQTNYGIFQIPMQPNDIVYEPFSGMIYASMPTSAGLLGNTVVPIDATTGAVGTPVYVGSEPDLTRVSDDGQYLYVSLDGASSVRRVNLATQTADIQIYLSSPLLAQDMAVPPGQPHSVAVSRYNPEISPRHVDVIIYDDGVARRKDGGVGDYIQFSDLPNRQRFGPILQYDQARLYGYEDDDSFFTFSRCTVAKTGIVSEKDIGGLINYVANIVYDSGRIYSTTGVVFDPETAKILGNIYGGSVRPDGAHGVAYVLSGNSLYTFDTNTFQLIGTFNLQKAGGGGKLILCGNGALAFLNGSQIVILTPTNAQLTSLTAQPTTVTGGNTANGVITLDSPAPLGGLSVSLSSNNTSAATVPSSVTVPAGQTSTTFPITTLQIASNTTVSLSATLSGTTVNTSLNVNSVQLTAFTLDPSVVTGGNDSTGIVTIDSPAPTGGARISLSQQSGDATILSNNVIVPEGQTTATFPVMTPVRTTDMTSTLSASRFKTKLLATLTILAAHLTTLTLDPSTVVGGDISTGTLTLNLPAPMGGITVSLLSQDPNVATVPAQVTIPAGDMSATFAVQTYDTSQTEDITITARYNNDVPTAILTVELRLPTLTFFAISPSLVQGGADAVGEVVLDRPAPAGGTIITLTNTNPAADVPATLTVKAGQTRLKFIIPTTAVSSLTTGTVTATLGAISLNQTLTVRPVGIASVQLSPNPVQGGQDVTGQVTLTTAAPTGGITVNLSSSNPGLANPSVNSVTVPAGQISAVFTVNTVQPQTKQTVSIRATTGGITKSKKLTVLP